MKRKLINLSLFFLLSACGDKTPTFVLPKDLYSLSKVYDVSNNNNASDIRVEIAISTELVIADIREVRLIISKAAKSVTPDQIAGLSADNFYAVPIEPSLRQVIKITAGTRDTDGEPIVNGVPYKVYIGVLGKQDSKQLSPAKDLTLQDKNIYSGIYKGIWEDLGFPGPGSTASSIRLEEGFGEFFFTPNLKPFISGVNDGSFQMTLNGTNFSFDLKLFIGGYKGGCPATGPVSGHFEDDIILVSDIFSWDDCDGKRDVRLRFTRQ